MPSCAVTNCKNRTEKGYRVFRVPTGVNDTKRRQIWLDFIGRGDNLPAWACICEAHFDDSQFETKRADNRKLLKWNAIPNQKPSPTSTYIKTERLIEFETVCVSPPPIEMEAESFAATVKEEVEEDVPFISNLQFQRLTNELKACKRTISTLDKNMKQLTEKYENIFNADQVRFLKTGGHKGRKGTLWSDDTVGKALRLYMACGVKGYNEILRQNLPYPSIRTLQYRMQRGLECKAPSDQPIEKEQKAEHDEVSTEEQSLIFEVITDNQENALKVECQTDDLGADNSDTKVAADLVKSVTALLKSRRVTYSCPLCKKTLPNKHRFMQHRRICQKYTLHNCEVCDQQFSSVSKRDYHMKMKHGNSFIKVNCTVCGQAFDSLSARSTHMRTKHGNVKFTCDVCDTDFKTAKCLSYHRKTKHSDKEFVCEICSKAFHFKVMLNTHMESHNRNIKNSFLEICPKCGKGFHSRCSFFYHMKIHRGVQDYVCSYCGHKFYNNSALTRHSRMHTGEKPYKCEMCGKDFRSTTNLKNHQRTHTGERPYPCKYCDKSFMFPFNCKLHMTSHSGDIPCGLCKRSFIDEEVLRLHLKFKHKVKEGKMKTEDSG
ncbi:hypothetical protein NQ315_001182 [Exocentrus adspersus]|uniref:Uncharacterized protein n=1 Tax=Exocentrus adspersus TaxID=1586481 RepID=A0AAV8WH03_9CUCU|nr:hypothetical protein NQ315_001182 [Exocentrus adspersus]